MLQGPIIGFVILLAAALVGGMVAHRLKQPVILGYLVIGAAVGPNALGLVGDRTLIETAATMGVALLMFTLGLEISLSQLKQVGRVGIWGSVAQIVITAAMGILVGTTLFRWSLPQSILFGLIISLSSTAVCMKILMERGELDSMHGSIMMAILILQDISVVGMAIVTPLMGGSTDNILIILAIAIGKVVLLVGAAIVSGLWVLPWLMGSVGGIRSRELFLLTILVLCLGAALSTQVFGLSAVFGAFLIGLVLRESRFGHQALAEITPLRDIFATLFFVSLGMLLSLPFVIENWISVLLVVAAIILIKVLVVFGIVRFFGYSGRIAYLTGAGLFQVGELGFILAQGGLNSGIISEQFYSLIIAGAVTTMLLTPISMSLAFRLQPKLVWVSDGLIRHGAVSPKAAVHIIIAGYGRIGKNIAEGLENTGIPYITVDIDPERISEARKNKIPCIYGDASNPCVLSTAGLAKAKTLVVVFPDPVVVVATVRTALEINPDIKIVARVHRAREAELLKPLNNVELISPEHEASLRFLTRILTLSGWEKDAIQRALPDAGNEHKFVKLNLDENI